VVASTIDGPKESDPLSSIVRSQRVLLRGIIRSIRRDDITLQQAAVLRILVQNGPCSMNRLSEELLVTPPNVTGIIDRLEVKGLVVRAESKEDRRSTEIRLTVKGEALHRKVRRDYQESLGRSLGALTDDEQESLARLLKKLAAEVERGHVSSKGN
jgi:DNA-binding MarR family transcriptional regulator